MATRSFPLSRSRQTLLAFPSHSESTVLSYSSIHSPGESCSTVPGPPPVLPNEVWHAILRPLRTFALKKFRLVCREWAVIGIDLLFETICLTSYEKSWSRLVSISTSALAGKVRSLEWNPLCMYESCADAGAWSSNYANLIQGLGHADILRFQEAYIRVYRRCQSLLRSTSLESVSAAWRRLHNCQHIVFSDEYDLNSYCTDKFLRMGVQHAAALLELPTTWGLRAKRAMESEEASQILQSGMDVFNALTDCPNLTSLTLNCWDQHLEQMLHKSTLEFQQVWSTHCPSIQNRHIKSVCHKIKLPDRDWGADRAVNSPLYNIVRLVDLELVPAASNMTIQVSLVEPDDAAMIEAIEDSEDGIDDGDGVSDSGHSYSPNEDSFLVKSDSISRYRPDGMSEATSNSICSEVFLTFTLFTSLRTLNLCDISLNASSLLCWLCSQEQLPTRSLAMAFQGTVVLFDCVPKIFLRSLRQLNVTISYDAEETFFYRPRQDRSQPHDQYSPPILTCTWDSRGVIGRFMHCYSPAHLMYHHLLVKTEAPANMPLCPLPVAQQHKPYEVTIAHRPSEWLSILPDSSSIRDEVFPLCYYYRLRIHRGRTEWEWARQMLDLASQDCQPVMEEMAVLYALTVER